MARYAGCTLCVVTAPFQAYRCPCLRHRRGNGPRGIVSVPAMLRYSSTRTFTDTTPRSSYLAAPRLPRSDFCVLPQAHATWDLGLLRGCIRSSGQRWLAEPLTRLG